MDYVISSVVLFFLCDTCPCPPPLAYIVYQEISKSGNETCGIVSRNTSDEKLRMRLYVSKLM